MTVERSAFEFSFDSLRGLVLRDRSKPNPWDVLVIGVPDGARDEALERAGFTAAEAVLVSNVVLVEVGDRLVLVDTGWGPGEGLLELLESGGVDPEDVDLVVLTHSDGDHVGGLMTERGLALPAAEHVMHGAAWEWWTSERYLERLGADGARVAERAHSALEGRLKLVEGGAEVAPGVVVRELPGHRSGHIGVVFQRNREVMLHWADGLLHPIFVHRPEWHSGIDSNPKLAASTRRELLEWASGTGAWIASAHFPYPGLGTVTAEEGGRRWVPVAGNGPTDA